MHGLIQTAGEARQVGVVEAGVQGRRQRLRARDQRAAPPPPIAVVLLVGSLLLHVFLDDLLDVANLDEDVLGLEVGVDDAALAVQVVQAEQDLLGNLLHEGDGDAAVVPALDQAQQVLAQHLEDHADVGAVGALVLEGVEEGDDVLAPGVVGLGLDDLAEQLDLVDGGLGVVCRRAHDLERDVLLGGVVPRQPDGAEVAPAQLAHHRVLAVLELLADGHRVVAALAVVLRVLLVGCGLGGVLARGGGGGRARTGGSVRVRVRIQQIPQQRGHDGGEGGRRGKDMWEERGGGTCFRAAGEGQWSGQRGKNGGMGRTMR